MESSSPKMTSNGDNSSSRNTKLCKFFYRRGVTNSFEDTDSSVSQSNSQNNQSQSYDYPEFARSYAPGLDLPDIINSIPYDYHKLTNLTFELRSKYKCQIQADTPTRVISSLFISKQHPDWHMTVKSCDKGFFKINQLELSTGAVSPDFSGNLEVIVRSSKAEGQIIPADQVLGKVVCRPYLISS